MISSKLGEAEITPSPGSWNGLQRELRWKQFMRFFPGKPNIFYLGGLLIVGAGLIILSTRNGKDGDNSVQPTESESYSQDYYDDT